MTETSTHLQEIALEKAMVQSADEAAAWPTTPLARFALALCNELELKSDELAGMSPLDGEAEGCDNVRIAINDACNQIREALSDLRRGAVDIAGAGFEDEYHEECVERDTPTVSEALAKMRKEARVEPILSPHHTSTGIWL